MTTLQKVLLFGYGNPGRLDDGLGPALAEAVEVKGLPDVTVDANYQLSVEDASAVAEHDVIIFADASVNCQEPFTFTRLYPGSSISFTTHSVEPDAVLALARDLFKAEPPAYALAIRGYDFNEFGQKLSAKAQANLAKALEFIISALEEKNLKDE